MLRLCRSLPPSLSLKLHFENDGAKIWEWLAMLVSGKSDIPLDPQATALLQAKKLLQRRSSIEDTL